MKLTKKKYIILGSIVLPLLLLSLVFFLLGAGAGKHLQSQQQAERWTGESETRYTQFSAFFGPNDGLNPDGIGALRQQITEKLTAASIELPQSGKYFCDAWSTSGSVKISSERGSFDADVMAVGGSFFDFHPQELRSGVLLQESDLLLDRIVIDEQLAWLLYGSTDLAGMTAEIGGQQFYIAGVIARDLGRAEQKVAEDTMLLYMPYNSYLGLNEAAAASCYEVVLPDPAKGFAKALLEECLPKDGCILQQNTNRFRFSAALQTMRRFTTRAVRTEAVAFPVWENVALIAQSRAAAFYFIGLVTLLLPAALICFLLARLAIYLKWWLRGAGGRLKDKTLDKVDEHRIKRAAREGRAQGKG